MKRLGTHTVFYFKPQNEEYYNIFLNNITLCKIIYFSFSPYKTSIESTIHALIFQAISIKSTMKLLDIYDTWSIREAIICEKSSFIKNLKFFPKKFFMIMLSKQATDAIMKWESINERRTECMTMHKCFYVNLRNLTLKCEYFWPGLLKKNKLSCHSEMFRVDSQTKE
ncbi:hypothetical protein BpHYR1_007858 [Brachionus plicatilis]|uniref:Uncharacterized protein n=1 Tax=Brachionus plicatilis TaxID=10195 RepID=A0A3M7SX55_BRAPC|nr:hypothetical protein BpHYR1_007858 [Brachionus plicatilis]